MQYIWQAPWTTVKLGFLLNRYGNAIGQTFIMAEETGYLRPSETVRGISTLLGASSPRPHLSFVDSSASTAHSSSSSLRNPFGVSTLAAALTYPVVTENVVLVLMRAWAIWGYRYSFTVFLITLYALYVLAIIVVMIYTNYTLRRGYYDRHLLNGEPSVSTALAHNYLDEVGVCMSAIDCMLTSCVLGALTDTPFVYKL